MRSTGDTGHWATTTAIATVSDPQRDRLCKQRAVGLKSLSDPPSTEDRPIDHLHGFFETPRLIDLILAFTVLEAAVLVFWRRQPPMTIGLMLLPGICLLLAVRAALAGVPWPWLPLALAAALVAHLLDLRSRWLD